MTWSNFFVATAGASAALTGLIFVGVSINLKKILDQKGLPDRALISLILLLNILTLSLFLLVPDQLAHAEGTEILLISLVAYIAVTIIDWKVQQHKDLPYRKHYTVNMVLNQVALLPYLICGILVLSQDTTIDWPPTHYGYWLVVAILFSFIKSVIDAWVLLVEIHR